MYTADEEMPKPWKSTTSRVSAFLSQRDLKSAIPTRFAAIQRRLQETQLDVGDRQTWKQWAGQKIKIRRNYDSTLLVESERVSLFPGWAARRYENDGTAMEEAFAVDVFVSGFATSYRPPELASRSYRVFMRLAKGFAALPKLAIESDSELTDAPLTRSTEELLKSIKLPPKPTEITEDYDIEALEHQFERVKSDNDSDTSPTSSRSSSFDEIDSATPISPHKTTISSLPPPLPPRRLGSGDIRRLHANLESRLLPFWSSVLPGRTVRIHLFASPHQPTLPDEPQYKAHKDGLDHGPIASIDVATGPDGSFQTRFKVKWEDMCQHPGALHIAFGDPVQEHELMVVAELLPPPPSPSTASSRSSKSSSSSAASSQTDLSRPSPNSNFDSSKTFTYPLGISIPSPPSPPVVVSPPTVIRIPITHSPIRVISDIDDTIKLSNILSGARIVFNNVFVKDLKDSVIPGMGQWYTEMWKKGVRFHYVSNGPFELLPVVNEFFNLAHLPPGSIKLKSYSGRSLFNGLLTAPATRKRAGIQDILDAFPESRFMLIGDSGEQDLELYAEFARERPDQILAVFIRDVGDPSSGQQDLVDPTGWNAIGAAGTGLPYNVVTPGSGTPNNQIPTPRRSFSNLVLNRPPKTGRTPPALDVTIPENSTSYFTSSPLSAEPQPMAMEEAEDLIKTPRPTPQFNNPFTGRSIPSSTSNTRTSSLLSGTSTTTSSAFAQRLSDADRKRLDLQTRVYRARTQMPGHIPLRVFRDPGECVEARGILEGQSRKV